MFEFLKKLFGGRSDSTSDESNTITEDTRIGRDAWTWERADEYPFDHYTDAVEEVKQLKREGKHHDVKNLLTWCIDFVEAETEHEAEKEFGAPGIAPW